MFVSKILIWFIFQSESSVSAAITDIKSKTQQDFLGKSYDHMMIILYLIKCTSIICIHVFCGVNCTNSKIKYVIVYINYKTKSHDKTH